MGDISHLAFLCACTWRGGQSSFYLLQVLRLHPYISYLLKTALVLALLPIFNWIYVQCFWEDDLKKYDAGVLLDLYAKQDTCDLIYFGESSNFTFHPDDTQRLSISSLIGKRSGLRVGSLNKGAYHSGIYLPLAQRLDGEDIKYVVITVNLRTLNQATIHAPIETSLQKQARLFRPYPALWNRFMLTLNQYDNKELYIRDREMWYDWIHDTLRSDSVAFPAPTIRAWCDLPKFVDESGVQDMAKRTLADHYIKAYAFDLDPFTNPRIADLDEMIRVCRSKGYTVVLNFLAENTQMAEELLGEPLVFLMRKNRNTLKEYYSRSPVIFVDNLEAVPSEHYIDQDWTTEHYDEVGRQIIADNVSKAIEKTSTD